MSKNTRKSVVPSLRFPEFREQEHWEIATLGDPQVSSLVSDKVLVKDLKTDFYVSTENMAPDFGGVTGASKLPTNGSVSTFRKNDVLMSNIRPYLRKVWRADKPGTSSNDVIVFRSGKKAISEFVEHLLKSDSFIEYVMKGAEGVKMPRGDKDAIRKYPIALPSEREQRKISDCLASLDDLISAQKEKVAALKHFKQGLLQQLFPQDGESIPRLRFSDFVKGGRWKEFAINELIRLGLLESPQDGNHGEIHPKSEDYVEEGIPFVMANNVRNGLVDFDLCNHITKKQADSLKKGFSVEGDVLLTHKGTVGEVAIVKPSRFPYIMLTPQVTFYRIKAKHELLNTFLETAFISPEYQKQLKLVSGGGTRAYVGILEQAKLKISLPPTFKEQEAVANCISSLSELIATNNVLVKQLLAHKQGLLQQIFPSIKEGFNE